MIKKNPPTPAAEVVGAWVLFPACGCKYEASIPNQTSTIMILSCYIITFMLNVIIRAPACVIMFSLNTCSIWFNHPILPQSLLAEGNECKHNKQINFRVPHATTIQLLSLSLFTLSACQHVKWLQMKKYDSVKYLIKKKNSPTQQFTQQLNHLKPATYSWTMLSAAILAACTMPR